MGLDDSEETIGAGHLGASGPRLDRIFFLSLFFLVFPTQRTEQLLSLILKTRSLFCVVTTWSRPLSLESDKQIGICVSETVIEE